MLGIKIIVFAVVVIGLIIGALVWERRKNKKQGNLGYGDLPFMFKCIWQGVKHERHEARLTKYKETLEKFKG